MYKLSGNTLNQLADETDLTIDTINNLFYARLQKPGFLGVSALVKATGYSVSDLCGFLEKAEAFPAESDFTEKFAKYMLSVADTGTTVSNAKSEKRKRKLQNPRIWLLSCGQ